MSSNTIFNDFIQSIHYKFEEKSVEELIAIQDQLNIILIKEPLNQDDINEIKSTINLTNRRILELMKSTTLNHQ